MIPFSLRSRPRAVMIALAVLPLGAMAAPEGGTTFVVTASSTVNYTIDGNPDPALTLTRGQTYTFDLQNVGAIHPLFIKSVNSSGTGNQFTDGVTGNGASGNADIVFTVPMNAPAQLFYNCGTHAAMAGVLDIIDPPPEPPVFENGYED
jgi:hypothetical protein